MSPSALLHAARSFLAAEGENVRRYDLSWRQRLRLYRYGCLSSKGALWDTTDGRLGEYLTDVQGLEGRLRGIEGPFGDRLDDKVNFALLVTPTHGDLLPAVHGVVGEAGFVDVDRLDTLASFDELVSLLRTERVVAKPTTGAKGDGVRVLDGRGGGIRVDGRPVSRAELAATLRGGRDLILQEYVTQADYAAEVYPGTTNTIRVVTMVDPETREPFVAAAMHRFGTDASGAVDNASAGGVSAGVDVESGALGEVLSTAGAAAPSWTAVHPGTETHVAGRRIPAWGRVKSQVLDLAAEYGWLWPLAGWDVTVTDDRGSVTVIEVNPVPGTEIIQAHQPLLAEERTRRFFEHHGVA